MRIEVEPDGNGIVSVRHNLGTTNVQVTCERTDGSRVGYALHSIITADEIEVVTIPGSDVTAVVVQPCDDAA